MRRPGHTNARSLTAQAKAERLISEQLRRLGWEEGDLALRPKSDPAKLKLAARLRRETTLTVKAIAARRHLGTSRSANIRLHTAMRRMIPAEPFQAQPGL